MLDVNELPARNHNLHFVTANGTKLGPYELKPCSSFRLNRQHCRMHYDMDTPQIITLFENRILRPSYQFMVKSPNKPDNHRNHYHSKTFESSSCSNCNCRLIRHRMNSIWRFQLMSNAKKYQKSKHYYYFGNIIEDYHFLHTSIIWIQIFVTFYIFLNHNSSYFHPTILLQFHCILLFLSIIWLISGKYCHLNGLFDHNLSTKNNIYSSTQWSINGTSLPSIRSWISKWALESLQTNKNTASEKRIKPIQMLTFCAWIMFLIICPSTALRFAAVITSSNFEFLWILPTHYRLQQDLSWFIFDKLIKRRTEFTDLSEKKLKSMILHLMNIVIISQMLHLQSSEYNQLAQIKHESKFRKLQHKHLQCINRDFINLKSPSNCDLVNCKHLTVFRKEHINICKCHYYEWIKPIMILPGKYHWLFWNDTVCILFLIIVSVFRWYFMYDFIGDISDGIYIVDILCNIVGLLCVSLLLCYQLHHHLSDVDILTSDKFFWIDPEIMPFINAYFQPNHEYIPLLQNEFLKCFKVCIKCHNESKIIHECLMENDDIKINDDIIGTILEYVCDFDFVRNYLQSQPFKFPLSMEIYDCNVIHQNVDKAIDELFKNYTK